jgi:hypothetical protein
LFPLRPPLVFRSLRAALSEVLASVDVTFLVEGIVEASVRPCIHTFSRLSLAGAVPCRACVPHVLPCSGLSYTPTVVRFAAVVRCSVLVADALPLQFLPRRMLGRLWFL